MSKHQGIVYWSDRDGCYVGQCPSLFLGGVHGMNEKRVRAQLERVIRDWETTPSPKRHKHRRRATSSRSRSGSARSRSRRHA